MAIYHTSCKIISRNTGRSSVGASAYRSGEKLINERDGIVHDYTHKQGIVYSEVMLCENAEIRYGEVPQEEIEKYINSKEYKRADNKEMVLHKFENHYMRNKLWNDVEQVEKGQNAQLSREFEIALPKELTREQQIECARNIAYIYFVQEGMCADVCIHDKGDGNPHAHIMCTMRPIDENGQWENKAEKLYLCKNAKGEEKAFTSSELSKSENAEWQKQYHYSKDGNPKGKKVYLSEYEKENNPKYADYKRIKGDKYPKSERYGKQNPLIERWNSEVWLRQVREGVADEINTSLMKYGHEERVDHRSYEEQGVELIPTIHLGVQAHHMEKRGIETERGSINRRIKIDNSIVQGVIKQIKEFTIKRFNVHTDIQLQNIHNEIQLCKAKIPQITDIKEINNLEKHIAKLDDKMQKIKESGAFKGYEVQVQRYEGIHAYVPKMEYEYERYKKASGEVLEMSHAKQKDLLERNNKNLQENTITELKGLQAEYKEVCTRLHECQAVENRPRVTNEYATAYNNAERCLKEIEKNNAIFDKAKQEKANLSLVERYGKEGKSCNDTMNKARENINRQMEILNKLGIKDLSQAPQKMKEMQLNDQKEKQTIETFNRTREELVNRTREIKNRFEELKETLPPKEQENIGALTFTAERKVEQNNSHGMTLEEWEKQLSGYSQAVQDLRNYEKSVQDRIDLGLEKENQSHEHEQTRERY